MSALWDKSVKFIRDKETRVREEEQQIGGEEYLVWRWLQVGEVFTGFSIIMFRKAKFNHSSY